MAAAVEPIVWKKRAVVVRKSDAVYRYLWSWDARYVVVHTHSLLAAAGGGYADRWAPYWCPVEELPPARLTDRNGAIVVYVVSSRMAAARAQRIAKELAMRACCLHAAGLPIPPARKPLARKQRLRRFARRIGGPQPPAPNP